MTKTDLIAQVAANTEMSKKSAEQAVSAVFEALGKAMTEGEKITISGFGTFEVRERAERQGINPRTREPITIAASRSIVFKPGKSLKLHDSTLDRTTNGTGAISQWLSTDIDTLDAGKQPALWL